jgi:hypothetical protein
MFFGLYPVSADVMRLDTSLSRSVVADYGIHDRPDGLWAHSAHPMCTGLAGALSPEVKLPKRKRPLALKLRMHGALQSHPNVFGFLFHEHFGGT